MYYDLTRGKISRSLILFALPMIAGNLLQQFYNIADTLIVGRVLGSNALAAVGSSYTLMTFLTSIFLGLSMGAGALFSIYQGRKDLSSLKLSILHAFLLILAVTLVLNLAVKSGTSENLAGILQCGRKERRKNGCLDELPCQQNERDPHIHECSFL